ncbi:MAG: proton-conducting transporter membrane subunit [Candidatus Bathyarchaeota archaeon]
MVGQEILSTGFVLPLPLAVLLMGGLVAPIIGLLMDRLHAHKVKGAWMVLVSVSTLFSVLLLYQQVKTSVNEILVITMWGQGPPLAGCFQIDMLSVFMAGSIAVLGTLVAVYSISYMEKESRLTEFYTLAIFMMAGMMGIVMSGDFFTLFVFWELMGLSSYVLVSFLKKTWGPIEAGFKYLLMSATAGAFLLLSMALLYGMTGTLNFAALSASLRGVEITPWLVFTFSCLIIGFGVKSAIVPLHTWLPDAHPEAPSPISALLSGIVIETGLYAMIRLLYLLFEPSFFMAPMATLAVITMTLGNVMALKQDDIKRLLAYSSIAQIGYMLIGVSTGLSYGLLGTFLHVFNHSLMKGVAFLAAGSIVHETGTRDINEMRGVGRMMPFTTLAIIIAFLGLGGVPGTNGFISKFILFNASLGAGIPILAIVGVLNSTLSMVYYLKVIMILLDGNVSEGVKVKEAPLMMVGVTTIMAILVVALGFYPNPIMGIATDASEALIKGLVNYIGAVLR